MMRLPSGVKVGSSSSNSPWVSCFGVALASLAAGTSMNPDVFVVLGIEVALPIEAIDRARDDLHVALVFGLAAGVFLLLLCQVVGVRVAEKGNVLSVRRPNRIADTERGRSVIVQASPPASDSSASCDAGGLPSLGGSPLPRTNAIHLPSGDHRGSESCLPLVRRLGASEPEVATIQSAVS